MCQISIEIPEEVLYDTKMTKEETYQMARKFIALGYYTQNKVSIGYCSQIAGMTEADFLEYLGQNQISVFHFDSKDEFLEELTNA